MSTALYFAIRAAFSREVGRIELLAHPAWGVVALPLLARLYVRKKNLPAIDPKHRPEFRTKLEMAVELLRWAEPWLGLLG